jgi:hypothetical protein
MNNPWIGSKFFDVGQCLFRLELAVRLSANLTAYVFELWTSTAQPSSTSRTPFASARRLIGALCADQHEGWSTGRHYLTMDEFFEGKSRLDTESVSLDASTTSKQQPAAVAA